MNQLKTFLLILITFTCVLSLSSQFSVSDEDAINNKISSPTTEVWEGQGLEWYYDNLDDIDRRKIRQAMDYSIPRQQIIDDLHNGLAVPLATEIGQNVMGYDDSVQPRSYSITTARALMAEAYESLICDLQDLVVLAGLGLNILFGWWWADPIMAMVLIPFLIKEGLESFRDEQD